MTKKTKKGKKSVYRPYKTKCDGCGEMFMQDHRHRVSISVRADLPSEHDLPMSTLQGRARQMGAAALAASVAADRAHRAGQRDTPLSLYLQFCGPECPRRHAKRIRRRVTEFAAPLRSVRGLRVTSFTSVDGDDPGGLLEVLPV